MFKRIFLIVLDSLGIGAQEDAHLYNDVGAHTIQNILKHKTPQSYITWIWKYRKY